MYANTVNNWFTVNPPCTVKTAEIAGAVRTFLDSNALSAVEKENLVGVGHSAGVSGMWVRVYKYPYLLITLCKNWSAPDGKKWSSVERTHLCRPRLGRVRRLGKFSKTLCYSYSVKLTSSPKVVFNERGHAMVENASSLEGLSSWSTANHLGMFLYLIVFTKG